MEAPTYHMSNLKIFGEHDDATIAQIKTCLDAGGVAAVLCADGHKGYSQPIGGVVAYDGMVSISGVGYDIACGNLAVKTTLHVSEVAKYMENYMDRVFKEISFGVGRVNNTPIDHALFESPAWNIPLIGKLKDKAAAQLGTIGSGNHYVDIFADETDTVWVGVHFGSRGLGHGIATGFLHLAGGADGMDVPPTLVPESSETGQLYLQGMELAGQYAYAGREYVARYVASNILGGGIVEEIHNHHNFCWRETHVIDGVERELLVVRKGATPAFPGQKGFVGGSMGDDAVIIEGVEGVGSRESLYSTVHGAGRIMSRTAARGKTKKNKETGEIRVVEEPRVIRAEMDAWVKERGVVLRGADLDEAPQAYRRLPAVLRAHGETIKVLHTLRPLGVAMAGKDVFDPYKD
jgi:tRNA-splicing ligase RtcB